MAGRKEYEMLFQLNAQLGGSYNKTFKAAQDELCPCRRNPVPLQDAVGYSAYQKQQARRGSDAEALELLQQQYDNIQQEMEETAGVPPTCKNKLLAKQQQIDKTTSSLERQTAEAGRDERRFGRGGVDIRRPLPQLRAAAARSTR